MPETISLSALFRRILLTAFLLSFLLSTSLSRAQKWVEIRSPHFVVDTDAGDKRGREVALHFEQMCTIFGQLFIAGVGINHKMRRADFNPLLCSAQRRTQQKR